VDADATTILTKIDGHRSIEEVAVAVGYGVLEVTRIVEGLIGAGLVELERPRDAIGDELDDAIRQLSGHTPPSDIAPSHAGDGAGETQPAGGTTDLHGPLIEAALPSDPGEPATPAREPGTAQEVPSAGAAEDLRGEEEAQNARAADETGVSWDDLFGGGQTGGRPAARVADPPADPPADPTARGPERSAAPRSGQDAAGATPTRSDREESREESRTPVDPPPFFADTRRPETPSGGTKDEPTEPDRRPDRRSTDEDTDVSEFLRELSRLALGEDAPPTPRRSDVEPPPPGNAPRPAASHDEDRARRSQGPADTEHARRRRGFFGRG
jgi:hypothetical protein